MKIKIVLFFCIIFVNLLFTQEKPWENPNLITLKIDSTTIKYEYTEAIIQETLAVLDEHQHQLQNIRIEIVNEEKIIKLSKNIKNGSVKFYINPNLISKVVYENDSTKIQKLTKNRILTEVLKENSKTKKLFEGINSSGSIIRGITFGNNQSASVQSSLDLTLSGKLSDEIHIKAVIFDHNLPIQSGGYTQNLNEFDRVYIELFNKKSFLRAGHLDLFQNEHFFTKFNQKVTGIQAGSSFKTKTFKHDFQTAGSISRGEFVNYQFIGQEGNQGPYRLKGNHSEAFIIILSGSERIYLNGFLLTRGEDKDYVINYSTGELIFSNQRMMTANSRITAEYLYTNQNYNRFAFLFQTQHESEKVKITTQYFSEGDQKDNPINQNFNLNDLNALKNAGNDENLMFSNSEIETSYESNRVLYKKINENGIETFKHSTDSTDKLFSVSFLNVGENKGDYVLTNSSVNGRVFEYKGISQGNYLPIKRLIPANNLKLFSTNAKFSLLKTDFNIDFAYSNHDKNLFSEKDDTKNHGFATKISAKNKLEKNKITSTNQFDVQYINKNFHILNRINSVEFNRDFNLTREFSNQNQIRFQFFTQNMYDKFLQFSYRINYLNEQNITNGIKNDADLKITSKIATITSSISLLNSENKSSFNLNEKEKTNFLRFSNTIEKNIKKHQVGVTFEGENNIFKNLTTNQLNNLSFNWKEMGIFHNQGDSTSFFIRSRMYYRTDDSIKNNQMTRLNSTLGGKISSQLFRTKTQNVLADVHYRNVMFNPENKSENIVLSSIKWNKNYKNQALTTSILYELGSGREAQREFTYVRVTDGRGIYKWTDYNNNQIEDPDEFEVAEFIDLARYNRIFTGNINFKLINKNRLNLVLNIKPSRFFSTKKDFLERITVQNSIQFFNSYNRLKAVNWDPFEQENSIQKNHSWLSSLQFNQLAIHRWDFSYKFTNSTNNQFLFIGIEGRNIKNHQINFNYKFFNHHFIKSQLNIQSEFSESEQFSNRRYFLLNNSYQIGYSYRLENTFESSIFYKNQKKENTFGNENLTWNEFTGELRWNKNTTALNLLTSYIKTNFDGNSFSLVGNQMLEGFKAGNSFLWRVSIQKDLTSYLQLQLNYEGRKNENLPIIHIGNVQLRASF